MKSEQDAKPKNNNVNGNKKINGEIDDKQHDDRLKLNRGVFVVFLILSVDLIAFTIILPLFPSLLDHYEANQQSNKDFSLQLLHDGMNQLKRQLRIPGQRQYNNVLIGGMLGSLFSTLQFLASPVVGLLSDVHGRKPILLLSMAGTLISYMIWMQAETFSVFLISRIIGGLCKGSVTICTAIMADLTSKETRGKAMALVGVAFSIGFSTGPLLGAYFATKYKVAVGGKMHIVPPLLCLVLQLLAILVVVLFLKESQSMERKRPKKNMLMALLGDLNPFGTLKKISCSTDAKDIRYSKIWSLGITQFFYLILFSGLEFTLTFLTHQRFHFTRREQGMLFLFIGLFMSITQGGYVRRVKHGKEKRVAMQGIAVLIPAMIVVALASSVTVMYVGVFLYCFGAATVIPCLTTLVSKQAGEDDNGETLGVFRSLGALARAVGPFLTCSLYWSVGATTCYFVGGALFILPLVLLSRIKDDVKTE